MFSPCVKTSECQRAIPRRFDPTTETDKFCQMPDKTWRFPVVGVCTTIRHFPPVADVYPVV
ncbi:hypothetical protein A464_3748 [Salmonella bongori N268-08]|uniref:Uncharacterized protein n=1 Tax=Salmonella bongori N268-08 TaxID=1197719 RepID=S5NKY7_SALBN|nr:hypothetical protein A464_3748 [Salmonella bongori N268-08]